MRSSNTSTSNLISSFIFFHLLSRDICLSKSLATGARCVQQSSPARNQSLVWANSCSRADNPDPCSGCDAYELATKCSAGGKGWDTCTNVFLAQTGSENLLAKED